MIIRPGHEDGPTEASPSSVDHLVPADFVLIALEIDQRLDGVNDATEAVGSCLGYLDGLEAEHGAYTSWDTLRLRIVNNLVGRGMDSMALGVVRTIRAPHTQVDTLGSMSSGPAWQRYLIERTFRSSGDARRECLRAFRDRLILRHRNHPFIPQLEREFSVSVANYNAVADWAESQAREHPGADWGEVVAIVDDDEAWNEVELNQRRHIIITLIRFEEACAADEFTQANLDAIGEMLQHPARDRYRPLRDRLRARCVYTLMDHRLLDEAEGFLVYVRDAEMRSSLRQQIQAQRDALAADDGQQAD